MQEEKKKIVRISLEGNIGAGKSELLKFLSRNGHQVVLEPTAEWEAIQDSKTGKNIIEMLYENPQKNAFLFQIFALATRIQAIENTLAPGGRLILERCIDTDKLVFAKSLHYQGLLTDMEYEIYQSYAHAAASPRNPDSKFSVDGMIYLRTSTDRCFERIQKRQRKGEENIDMDYLHILEDAHEEMIDRAVAAGIPVLILDGDLELFDLPHKMSKIDELLHVFD
jgi:deoxyadenosine/deoxycytidine kinase